MASITDLINAVSTGSAVPSSSDVSAANTGYSDFISQEPGKVQALTGNLQNEAGIPAQQSQYANLGSIFQLWLNDPSRTTGQYASKTLSTGNSPLYTANTPMMSSAVNSLYPGSVAPVANPYLQSANDIVNAVSPNLNEAPNSGFTGFTTPGLINSAVGVVPNAASGIQSGLQSTMNAEQGTINQDVGTYEQNYQNAANAISQLASALTTSYSTYGAPGAQSGIPGTPANTSFTEMGIEDKLGYNATWQQVYNYINSNQATINGQGGNAKAMLAWAKQQMDNFGANTAIQAGKAPNPATKTKTQSITNKDGSRSIYQIDADGKRTLIQTIPAPAGPLGSALNWIEGLFNQGGQVGTQGQGGTWQ